MTDEHQRMIERARELEVEAAQLRRAVMVEAARARRRAAEERDHASVLAAMDREQMQTVFRRARELHALEMSDAGLTYTKIGELIGRLDDGEPLSGAGVSFLVEKARRRRQWHIERGRPIEVLPH
jgi:microsomal dipeptidase-like Zn-dependent dipeptidase